jgi:hypothetical protein
MKVSRDRYQSASVRKVPRAQGKYAWEFRFYVETPEGRKLKVQTFDPVKYPTEKSVRMAMQPLMASINTAPVGRWRWALSFLQAS